MASSISTRRALRKIPALRSLPSRELESIQNRLVSRSYRSGELLWHTRDPLEFTGFIQSGEIEVEYRIRGVLVRSTRLCAGDPIPARNRPGRKQRATLLARAVTDVELLLLPAGQVEQPGHTRLAAKAASPGWLSRVWPLLLLTLIVVLGRADIVRIASGLLYMASNHEGYTHPHDPRPMNLLKVAEQVDLGSAFAFNEEGYRWFQQEKLPDAESAFAQAIKTDPTNAQALNNAAVVYFILGDLKQSTQYLQRSVEQDPNNVIARYNLGIILMQQNYDADAIQEFREASFIDPKAASPHLQQAVVYARMGDDTDAERHARAATQLDPSQAAAHLLLAIALYDQSEYEQAFTSIANTLSLEPDNRVAAFYRALILARLEQYDDALLTLERLLETSADDQESARISVEVEAIQRSLTELEAAAH